MTRAELEAKARMIYWWPRLEPTLAPVMPETRMVPIGEDLSYAILDADMAHANDYRVALRKIEEAIDDLADDIGRVFLRTDLASGKHGGHGSLIPSCWCLPALLAAMRTKSTWNAV